MLRQYLNQCTAGAEFSTDSCRGSVLALPETNKIKIYRCADCQVPLKAAGATKATSEAPSSMFRDWQRTQTQSSATALTEPEAANGCPVLRDAGTIAERHTCAIEALEPWHARSPERAKKSCAFLLTKTYMDGFFVTFGEPRLALCL
jgi:hypothetical protein